MFTYSENLRQKEHHVDSFAIADEIMSIITDYLKFYTTITDAKVDAIQQKLKDLLDTPGFNPKVERGGNDLFGRLLIKLHDTLSWSTCLVSRSYNSFICDDDPIVWPVFDRLLTHPSTRLTDTVHTVKREHFTNHEVQMTLTEALFFALDERKFMETLSLIMEWDSFDCRMSMKRVGIQTISSGVFEVCGNYVEVALRIIKHLTFDLAEESDEYKYHTPLIVAIDQRCLPVVRAIIELADSLPQVSNIVSNQAYENALGAVTPNQKPECDSTEEVEVAILKTIMEHPNCRVNKIRHSVYRDDFNPRVARSVFRCEKFDMHNMPVDTGFHMDESESDSEHTDDDFMFDDDGNEEPSDEEM